MPRNLFFFDFDETLYSHSAQRIPRSAGEALRRLQSAGHMIIIATGRGPESMDFIRQQLTVSVDTMILLNGQMIYHKGNKISERFITLPSMNRIIQNARHRGIAYGGYCARGEVVDHVNDRVAAVWEDFRAPMPTVIERFEDQYPLYHGHLYITKEESVVFDDCLGDYVINWSHEYLVNLIAKDTGKSQGIRWAVKQYGVPLERTYAFGDGFNDEDMLRYAGHGIAMGNASELLKQAADYVTDAVDEDGIVRALEFYKIL